MVREDFTDAEIASEKLGGFSPRSPGTVDLMEFHFFWDVDDDGAGKI